MRYLWLVLLLLPSAWALIIPHAPSYDADLYARLDVCATVYTTEKNVLTFSCDNELIGERVVPANVPQVVCFPVLADSSKECTFELSGERAYVFIHVFPRSFLAAILSVLLVVLIVRFAVKLAKIYIKAK